MALTLLAVGDVAPQHADGGRNLEAVRDLLRSGDITFGRLEEPLSNRGDRHLYAGLGGPLWDGPPFNPDEGARLLLDHGFDVMSFAGNHAMDRSAGSMFDTLDATRKAGLRWPMEVSGIPFRFDRPGDPFGSSVPRWID
jgi:hypothetical protein